MLWLLLYLICPFLAAFIAAGKDRSIGTALVLGFFLGPLGVLIVALLESHKRPTSSGGSVEALNARDLYYGDDRISAAEVDRIIDG